MFELLGINLGNWFLGLSYEEQISKIARCKNYDGTTKLAKKLNGYFNLTSFEKYYSKLTLGEKQELFSKNYQTPFFNYHFLMAKILLKENVSFQEKEKIWKKT